MMDKFDLHSELSTKDVLTKVHMHLAPHYQFCDHWYPAYAIVSTLNHRGKEKRSLQPFLASAAGCAVLHDLNVRMFNSADPLMQQLAQFWRMHYPKLTLTDSSERFKDADPTRNGKPTKQKGGKK